MKHRGNEAGLKMKVSTERQGGAESQRETAFFWGGGIKLPLY